jgi:hypothetical protein
MGHALLCSASAIGVGSMARAVSTTYVGPNNGSFSTPGNWSTGVAPKSGDDVLDPGSVANIDFDYGPSNYSSGGFNSLTINGGTVTESPGSGTVYSLQAQSMNLGSTGSFFVQGGVGITTNIISGDLTVGTNDLSSIRNTYELTSSSGTLSVGGAIVLETGDGSSEFLQSAGSVSAGSVTVVTPFQISRYVLSGGTLTVGTVNTSGNPVNFQWSAGTLHLTNQELDFTSAADVNASFGNTLTLNSGQSLIVDNFETLSGPSASVTQYAGSSNTPVLGLDIGNTAGGYATYSLIGGVLTCSSADEVVGYGYVGTGGEGYFLQNGGSNTTQGLYVGGSCSGVTGEYDLYSGASLNVSGYEYIGATSQGLFEQYGGTHTIGGGLQIGGVTNGVLGALNVETGTLSAPYIWVGGTADGQGVLTFSNGTITVSESLDIANNAGSYVSQSGGTLTVGTLNTNGNPSSYQWTAGTLQLTAQPLNFTSGSDVDASFGSSLTLGSGQTLIVDNWEWLYGNGAYISESSGSSNSCQGLYLGNTSGGGGDAAYFLDGGSLTNTVSPEYVGYAVSGATGGKGYFYQYGGANNTPELDVGYSNTGVTGEYDLYTGATLTVSGNEYIGVQSQGTFNQNGGTHTIGSNLFLGGSNSGALGEFNLDGGTLSAANVYVGGSAGQGILAIGNAALTVGGTLNVVNTAGSYVFQAGGTVTTGNTVNAATYYEAAGMANLGPLSGTGSLTIAPSSPTSTTASMIVSALNQSSVTINSTGTLKVTGGSHNTVNTLTINGGQLDLTNTHLFIDYGSGPDPISMIRAYLIAGCNGGAWNGPGINSSIAALPANSHYGIGYADGADGIVAGLSSGQIEIKYTLLGDADLDGAVTGSDFTILASNPGQSVSSWDKGDFDYDGVVSGSDFTALVENLGKSASGADIILPAADYAAIDAFAAANGLMADVPEPASMLLIPMAGFGILARRRRG